MNTPVLVKFSKKQIKAIDLLVAEGMGAFRSEVARRAVESLDEAICRMRTKLEVKQSNREQPQIEAEEARAMPVEIAIAGCERWVWTDESRCTPKQRA